MGLSEDIFGRVWTGIQTGLYTVTRHFGCVNLEQEVQRIVSGSATFAETQRILSYLRREIAESDPNPIKNPSAKAISMLQLEEMCQYHKRVSDLYCRIKPSVAQPISLTNNNLNKPPQHPKGYDGRTQNSA